MDLSALVVVGQTPPPYHGQSVMIERMVAGLRGRIPLIHVPMRFSRSIDDVGRPDPAKVFHLVALIARTIRVLVRSRPAVLYYPPASPALAPVLRDIVLLACIRPFARATVFHFHANGLAEFLRHHPVLRVFAGIAYRGCNLGIVLSSTCRADADYLKVRRVAIVPNGIPGAPDDAMNRDRSAPFTVLYVGSIQPSKGIDDIIEVAGRLHEKGLDCRFRVVGEWVSEAYRRSCLQRVAAGELQEIVQFPGPVTGDAKWEEYKNSDLFFFPSYYSVEGMSVAVIEAMSAGIPVIVSRWRGQVDLVEPGRTGFLVEPRDISGYVDCIESLYKDPALRVECGQGARLRFSELFTEAKHLECLESALLPVLEE